jgi:hypothetical protein
MQLSEDFLKKVESELKLKPCGWTNRNKKKENRERKFIFINTVAVAS